MNKLYTLLLVVFLAGCYPQSNAHNSANRAFTMACDLTTMETNLISSGDKMTITATCTKAK